MIRTAMPDIQGAHSTLATDGRRGDCRSVLDDRTLVLNRSWLAVNVTTVRRALTLAYIGCARVIQPDTFETHDFDSWVSKAPSAGERAVRTITRGIRPPEIIVLLAYDQQPALRVPFSRRNLFLRDSYRCQYCGIRASSEELSVDHVVPRSKGGLSTWTNCVLACHGCNVRKGSRTPPEAGMRLLRAPAQPRWPVYLTFGSDRRRDSWQRFLSEPRQNADARL
jgi:5-methylcytosine-specific restriction endonuclease McrA